MDRRVFGKSLLGGAAYLMVQTPQDNPDRSGITDVEGIEVGHFTHADRPTGCTVVLTGSGAIAGVDVRGSAPGTRETDLLDPVNTVQEVHAILLAGGSAFGLDAATGVVRYLAERDIGYAVGPVHVPIVPAAILYDLGLITSKVRPGPAQGYAACQTAGPGPIDEGTVGAGTGATVAKTGGPERAVKGGIGAASLTLPTGHVVAAVMAVNAIGGVRDHNTGRLVAGPRRPDGGFDDPVETLLRGAGPSAGAEHQNTTIGVVATDAVMSREEANYLARVSHDGLALTIRPCHTIRDGDTIFAMATRRNPGEVDLAVLGAAAVEVTARAVLRGVEMATGLGGIPSVTELGSERTRQ